MDDDVTACRPRESTVDPVLTGTCVPTLILAGMLSVAIRLGSERSLVYWRFSFAEIASSN